MHACFWTANVFVSTHIEQAIKGHRVVVAADVAVVATVAVVRSTGAWKMEPRAPPSRGGLHCHTRHRGLQRGGEFCFSEQSGFSWGYFCPTLKFVNIGLYRGYLEGNQGWKLTKFDQNERIMCPPYRVKETKRLGIYPAE